MHLELGFGHRHVMRLPDQLRVHASQALMGDLKALLGPNAVGGQQAPNSPAAEPPGR